jgi:Myb/SANT-like DNA-binding domain
MEKKNYSPYEQNLLIELVRKYKNVVENKETNAAMILKKRKSWEAISEEFNADSMVTKRVSDQLSKKWKNLKSKGAKEVRRQNYYF